VKYKKESESKRVYRPSVAKKSRSPPRCKFEDRDCRREEFIAAPYHPFEPPIPTSWIPPYADFSSHPSWDWYDSRHNFHCILDHIMWNIHLQEDQLLKDDHKSKAISIKRIRLEFMEGRER
jgi:hypothetical protein